MNHCLFLLAACFSTSVKLQITATEHGSSQHLDAQYSPRSASSSSVGIPSSPSWKQNGKSKHRNEMRQRNGQEGQRWRVRGEQKERRGRGRDRKGERQKGNTLVSKLTFNGKTLKDAAPCHLHFHHLMVQFNNLSSICDLSLLKYVIYQEFHPLLCLLRALSKTKHNSSTNVLLLYYVHHRHYSVQVTTTPKPTVFVLIIRF